MSFFYCREILDPGVWRACYPNASPDQSANKLSPRSSNEILLVGLYISHQSVSAYSAYKSVFLPRGTNNRSADILSRWSGTTYPRESTEQIYNTADYNAANESWQWMHSFLRNSKQYLFRTYKPYTAVACSTRATSTPS